MAHTSARTIRKCPGRGDAEKRSFEAAVAAARAADEGKAHDILLLHVEKAILVTDYFLIASVSSNRQMRSVARDIIMALRKLGYRGLRVEGENRSSWMLVDAGAIVIHIFSEEMRKFYDLELLWGDSPEVDWRGAVLEESRG